MEQLALAGEQHGHSITPTRLEDRITVDVDLVDRNGSHCDKRGDFGTHLVAEMTVRAGKQRQPHQVARYSPPPLPTLTLE